MKTFLIPLALLAAAPSLMAVNFMTSSTNDVYIRSGTHAGTVQTGTNIILKDAGATGNFARKGYIQFDVSTLIGAASEGYLKLAVQTNNPGGGANTPPQDFDIFVSMLNDGDPGESWMESAVTWNNAPANDTASPDGFLAANSTPIGTYQVNADPAGTTLLFPLNAATISALNADSDGLVTFLLGRDSASGGHNIAFHSGEAGNADFHPMLILVPEPSRAMLLLMSGCVMLLRRKRG